MTPESIFSTPVSMLNGVSLPKRIARLADLAYNLWWTWNPNATELFEAVDRQLWDETGHNPVKFLRRVKRKALNGALQDPRFLELYDQVLAAFDAYLRDDGTWYNRNYPGRRSHLIAYFSTEFGLHESFPTYAGGLGILSGDHAKEASDLDLPFVGIGFLYNQGYFSQRITEDGWQEAGYIRYSFDDVPVIPLLDADDKPLSVTVELPGRVLTARLWKIQVGRIPLLLLDSDIPENAPNDRDLTARVYGGDLDTRISQEIVLGIGGVRALRALGLQPAVWHMNEGHSAFSALERIREQVAQGVSFETALAEVRKTTAGVAGVLALGEGGGVAVGVGAEGGFEVGEVFAAELGALAELRHVGAQIVDPDSACPSWPSAPRTSATASASCTAR